MIEQRRAKTVEHRPTQGYAVVGVDTYGDPDEQGPYSAGEFITLEEAMDVAKELKDRSGEKVYVWGADGSVIDLDQHDG